MSQSSKSYAPSISDISYRSAMRKNGAAAPIPTTPPLLSRSKHVRRHPMNRPVGTRVEEVTMTAEEYLDSNMERIIYQDRTGMLVNDMIQLVQNPKSRIYMWYDWSKKLPDQHFCPRGYVCNYTLLSGTSEYPNIHSYTFVMPNGTQSKANVLLHVSKGVEQWARKVHKHTAEIMPTSIKIVSVAITSIGPSGTIAVQIQETEDRMYIGIQGATKQTKRYEVSSSSSASRSTGGSSSRW